MQILHITLTNRIEPKKKNRICRVMKSNLFVVNKFVRFNARTNRQASHSWQFFFGALELERAATESNLRAKRRMVEVSTRTNSTFQSITSK